MASQTETVLTAQPRSDRGSAAARRLRRAGSVPAVLYGQGQAAEAVSLDARELRHALAPVPLGQRLVVSLSGRRHAVRVGEVQRNPVRDEVLHLDLVLEGAGAEGPSRS
jgi:large subunit ribosomal protein L25